MQLSDNPRKLYDQVMEQKFFCTRSMGGRANAYARWENIYDKGAAGIMRGRLNKAAPAIDTQASLLFAAHLVRFWGRVPPEEDDEDVYRQVESVSEAVRLAWTDLELDEMFPMAVTQALVDGCYLLSITPQVRTDWEVELRADLIHPMDFGVGREVGTGSWRLDRQQSIYVRSYHTLEELDSWIGPRKDKQAILNKLCFVPIDQGERGTRITGMAPGAAVFQSKPENWPAVSGSMGEDIAERIAAEFFDLRIFDDEQGDWRVFTISGETILRDRRAEEIGVPHMLPYVKICATDDPKSFWGVSMIDKLSPLQEWYLNRTEGMDEKFRQSFRPPTAAIGLGGGFEERLRAFSKAGGRIAIPNQNAKIQRFAPELSDSDFTMMRMIASQIDEQSELPPMLRGRNEPGIRGEGALQGLKSLASAPTLRKSLKIEGQARATANLIFHSLRRYSKARLVDTQGRFFYLAEFPQDIEMIVDGHSSSPIMVEDHKELAHGLLREGLIKPSRALRLVAPPMEGSMLHEMRDIEQAQMIAASKIKQEQQMKRGGKESAGIE